MALTPRELELKNKLYNQYKKNKSKFIKDYGENAEQVMLGRAIKLAKNMTDKDNKNKIKEVIRKTLSKPLEEKIDSNLFFTHQKPASPIILPTPHPHKIDKENPIDIIQMDVPLFIRLLEFAKEEAKTDMDLHSLTENVIELSKKGQILDMTDYPNIISPDDQID
jgi:hypothetical protein